MTLGQKQRLFSHLVALLILKAYQLGYAVSLGDAHRSVEEATRLGKANSVHTLKLAIDLHLFKLVGSKWKYQTSTMAHKELGEWWEQQHSLCRWGGRFQDGNHYSMIHRGVM